MFNDVAPVLAITAALSLLLGVLVPPVIHKKLEQGILDAVIWRPDSPPETDGNTLFDR